MLSVPALCLATTVRYVKQLWLQTSEVFGQDTFEQLQLVILLQDSLIFQKKTENASLLMTYV